MRSVSPPHERLPCVLETGRFLTYAGSMKHRERRPGVSDQTTFEADCCRLSEIATILAAGLRRLRARQSTELSAVRENSSVDFTACQSGHAVQIAVTENA
jgi:hypothetical protein